LDCSCFSVQLEHEIFKDLCGIHSKETFKGKGEMKNEIYLSSKGVFKRRAFIPFSLPLKQLTIFISEFKKELKGKNGVTQALALI